MNRIPRRRLLASLLLASAGAAALAAPPPAILQYRQHMFETPVMTLANRTIELMFDTARVEPGRRTWKLPKKQVPLDFTYEVDGRTLDAVGALERTHTDAFLVIKEGVIVHEAYLNRTDERTHFMSYSMAKSLNSIAMGIAIDRGLIGSVDEPITRHEPRLAGTAYDGATLRDVLRMRSGADWDDNFFAPGPAKDINEAAFIRNEARFVTAAFDTKRKHAPGEVFNYNTVDAALIAHVVDDATGVPFSRFMSDHFWKPAGMESHGFYVLDGEPGVGKEFTGGGFNATLRDYGRIGLMMLNGGVANGRRILSESWVKESTTAAPGSARDESGLGYAYLWWTDMTTSKAFLALGGEGQFIYVDPETRTVIVKMSHAPTGADGAAVQREAFAFLRAAAKWNPGARGN